MRAFRLLVLRRMRQAPLRSIKTVLSIAAGVALAVSITILLASIERSLADFCRGLAGPAPLRIGGVTLEGGLPDEAVRAAEDVNGVGAVVPMVQTVGRIQASPGATLQPALVVGVDCRAEALFGAFGCDHEALAAATGALALGPALEGGTHALLRTEIGRANV